jgi:K(+)-stimulated pyrophosphate-energized sodium pump
MIDLAQLAAPLGLIGLLAAFAIYLYVRKQPAGTDRMQEIGSLIQEGAMAFLRREYATLVIFIVVVTVALWFATTRETAFAYVTGAISSMFAGFFGMTAATRANTRTAPP